MFVSIVLKDSMMRFYKPESKCWQSHSDMKGLHTALRNYPCYQLSHWVTPMVNSLTPEPTLPLLRDDLRLFTDGSEQEGGESTNKEGILSFEI